MPKTKRSLKHSRIRTLDGDDDQSRHAGAGRAKTERRKALKILFCASECYPFAKSGGLADVAYALPKALAKKEDVTLMLPWYRFMDLGGLDLKLSFKTRIELGEKGYEVAYREGSFEKIRVVFVKTPPLYESRTLYDEPQNDLRFALFSKAIADFVQKERFDILHLNDWHTALAALWVKERPLDLKVVFTIHNLAFQGIFPAGRLEKLGIDRRYFDMEWLEYYGQINFMKAGIAFCDALTTVSPTYAREILTPEFGCGLEGYLQKYRHKLSGILNGIDTRTFDPRKDPLIACSMKRKIVTFKACNKRVFLKQKTDLPLFVYIGRLTEQKGIDLLLSLAEKLAGSPLIFAFLGEGDETMQKALRQIAGGAPNLLCNLGYDEKRARQMYAAADFLVMPSRFEPCGLNQMIAMRYAAVPVVHRTGGLADTVHTKSGRCGRGIVFEKMSKEALWEAIEAALGLYRHKERLEKIRAFDMACDFSFEKPAKAYLRLYARLRA
ncbi:MAG: hypothetical protein B6D59_07850 [Campylobacteraceae bacterium 4484_4]|nr:MAG: hypothetical protein B6D59_07850 [Campylobacteraceae bacterium 4484_4]